MPSVDIDAAFTGLPAVFLGPEAGPDTLISAEAGCGQTADDIVHFDHSVTFTVDLLRRGDFFFCP